MKIELGQFARKELHVNDTPSPCDTIGLWLEGTGLPTTQRHPIGINGKAGGTPIHREEQKGFIRPRRCH